MPYMVVEGEKKSLELSNRWAEESNQVERLSLGVISGKINNGCCSLA